VTDPRADQREAVGQLLQVMGLDHQQRDAQFLELRALRRRQAARPEQHEVWLRRQQAFHVELPKAAEGRHPGQRGGTLATVEHTDQALAGIQFEHDFR